MPATAAEQYSRGQLYKDISPSIIIKNRVEYVLHPIIVYTCIYIHVFLYLLFSVYKKKATNNKACEREYWDDELE